MHVIFFDLETGGLEPTSPIIQIAAAAVNINTWNVVATREWKCLFHEFSADPEALKLNHYDAELWAKSAIPLGEAMDKFHAFCREYRDVMKVSKRTGKGYTVAQLGGFNTEAFDMPKVSAYFKDRGLFFAANPWTYDVLQLARWKTLHRTDLPDHKLPTLCQKFGIEHNAHDALGDVLATVELARRLMHE